MRISARARSAAAIAAAAIALPACDGTPGDAGLPPPTGCSGTTTVWLIDSGFAPACVAIPPGATVTFRNIDTTSHTVTSYGTPEGFDSRVLVPGQEFAHTFSSAAARVEVRCSLHPSAVGLVLVQ